MAGGAGKRVSDKRVCNGLRGAAGMFRGQWGVPWGWGGETASDVVAAARLSSRAYSGRMSYSGLESLVAGPS